MRERRAGRSLAGGLVLVCLVSLLVGAGRAAGAAGPGVQTGPGQLDWAAIEGEAVRLLQEYLRIETINPPGDELPGARFLARRLEAAGIEHEIFESRPGRANLYARLRGDGSRGGGVVLLHHIDVVPAEAEHWSVDPFGGVIRDGLIYGRGARDMKGYGVVQLVTFLALRRAGVPLARDVVLLATAGEESGGIEGAGHVVSQRRDLMRDVEFLLTEGGGGMELGGRVVHLVETTQKTPVWLRLRVTGPSGHGSSPSSDAATHRLVRALERIRNYRGEIRVVPPVAEALRAQARLIGEPDLSRAVSDLIAGRAGPEVIGALPPDYGPLLRNTISITVMQGSSKINVIPPVATAELDCRLLPGESPDLFIATLRDVIDDPRVQIEEVLAFEPTESPSDTALWRAIEGAVRASDGRAAVAPTVLAGFTDAHYFRRMGIVAYGWAPFVHSGDEGPVHGTDESILVSNVRRGPRLLYDVLWRLAGPRRTEAPGAP